LGLVFETLKASPKIKIEKFEIKNSLNFLKASKFTIIHYFFVSWFKRSKYFPFLFPFESLELTAVQAFFPQCSRSRIELTTFCTKIHHVVTTLFNQPQKDFPQRLNWHLLSD